MYKYEVKMNAQLEKIYLIDADSFGEAENKGHAAIVALAKGLPVSIADVHVESVEQLQDNGTDTAGSSLARLPCEWLPIELAPKDGTEILVRGVINAKGNPFSTSPYITGIYQDWWAVEKGDWENWPFHEFDPTHFIPIPPLKASDAE